MEWFQEKWVVQKNRKGSQIYTEMSWNEYLCSSQYQDDSEEKELIDIDGDMEKNRFSRVIW